MTFGHACHDSGDTREPMPFHKADVGLSWWRPGQIGHYLVHAGDSG